MGQGTPAQEHPVVGPAIQKWILRCPQSALCLSHANPSLSPPHGTRVPGSAVCPVRPMPTTL